VAQLGVGFGGFILSPFQSFTEVSTNSTLEKKWFILNTRNGRLIRNMNIIRIIIDKNNNMASWNVPFNFKTSITLLLRFLDSRLYNTFFLWYPNMKYKLNSLICSLNILFINPKSYSFINTCRKLLFFPNSQLPAENQSWLHHRY
jgi:hypothetical protein